MGEGGWKKVKGVEEGEGGGRGRVRLTVGGKELSMLSEGVLRTLVHVFAPDAGSVERVSLREPQTA